MVLFENESEIERKSAHCTSEPHSWTEIRLKVDPHESDHVFCPYHGVYELTSVPEVHEHSLTEEEKKG